MQNKKKKQNQKKTIKFPFKEELGVKKAQCKDETPPNAKEQFVS